MSRRTITNRLGAWSSERRLTLRTALAGLITFILGHMLSLPQAYWAVLTSVIVIQGSVGGSLKASLDRLLGTIAGAMWGVAVTLTIPHHGAVMLGLTLVVALAPLAFLAALRPSYRIAPVTAIIVLLSTTGAQLGPVHYALDRVLEIGLGCVVGFVVSLLVLPARAHALLVDAATAVILTLRDHLDLLLRDLTSAPDGDALAAAHVRLNQAMNRVEGLVEEVNRERTNWLTDAPDPQPIARTLRRLRHDLAAIGRTVTEPLPEPALRSLAESTSNLRTGLSEYLAGSAASFGRRRSTPSLEPIDAALRAFRHDLAELRRSGALREVDIDGVERLFSLAFALQQLRANLDDLADRLAEHGDVAPGP